MGLLAGGVHLLDPTVVPRDASTLFPKAIDCMTQALLGLQRFSADSLSLCVTTVKRDIKN